MIVPVDQAVAQVMDAAPVSGILKMLLKPKLDSVLKLMYTQGIVLERGQLYGMELTEDQAVSVLMMAAGACKIDTQPIIQHLKPTITALRFRGYVLTSTKRASV
jgi:hypothetical protein